MIEDLSPTSIVSPRQSRNEQVTMVSTCATEQVSQRSKKRFRLYTVDDLDSLPEQKWLIEGILPESGLAMVYGEPGAYKTFLGLDWALSISAGLTWHGRRVRQGDVVYIYAEGAKGLPKRISAWRKLRGGDVSRFRALPTSLNIRDDQDTFYASLKIIGRLAEALEVEPAQLLKLPAKGGEGAVGELLLRRRRRNLLFAETCSLIVPRRAT